MVHNVYYCRIHDRLFHGFRPVGPHFTNKDHERYGADDALKDGTLVDLGVCPYFKMPLGTHTFRVEQIDRDLMKKVQDNIAEHYCTFVGGIRSGTEAKCPDQCTVLREDHGP